MVDSAVSTILAERLRGARASVGFSTRRVADELPGEFALSHATIANYERGKTHPSMEVLAALAMLYGRPVDWFLESAPPLEGVVFRNLGGKSSETDLNQFSTSVHQWLEAYVKLERRLESPLNRDVTFRVRGNSGAGVAMSLRKHLELTEQNAVSSVIALTERFGMRSIEVPTSLSVDGLAGRFGDEFVVALNPLTSNGRARMLVAHELGHFIFKHHEQGLLEDQEAEDKAYEFASHLLLPSSMLQRAFESRSLMQLLAFKQTFGVPLSSMMFRAKRSGLIDKTASKWLASQFSKRGWMKKEPGVVVPDRATRFERLIETAAFDQRIRWAELESITGFNQEQLEERREFALRVCLGRYGEEL
ncbi:MAG: XRE family transcriptional regulator [Planctomycetota bacterium]|nr:XRE family transcriptional regulator [Planctomycetota bacterium]